MTLSRLRDGETWRWHELLLFWSGFELGGFGPDAERASASNAALGFGDKSHTAVVVVASLRLQSHLE